MRFSDVLKKERERVGLTQTELGKALHISFSSINRYENGKHFPTPIVLKAIKDFFAEKGIAFEFDEDVEAPDGHETKQD